MDVAPPRGRLVVFGAGGHGKVVADIAGSLGYEVVAFVDEAPGLPPVWALPVIGWAQLMAERSTGREPRVALGIGDNAARERCAQRVVDAGFELPALAHPRATVAGTARIGPGTAVMAGAVVNPDVVLGPGCIVNTGAVIEHDCVVGGFAHLSPRATLGGGVRIGERAHLGLGAVALPGTRIGRDVRVGAGAVVHRDVADGLTVVGVPARPLERK